MQSPGQISPDGKWWWNGAQWVPYQAPPAPATRLVQAPPYESAASRARVTVVLLGASIAGFVALTVAGVLGDVISNPDDNQSILIGLVSLLALLVWLATFIPSIVFFCMWLHRVERNMPALGAPDPRWSPARSVVYCFIPILNLFHPLWSVLDAWRGGDPSQRWVDVGARKAIKAPGVIVAWWATWLLGGYVSNVSARMSGAGAVGADVIGTACVIAAAVLGMRVVREVTARQARKQELIASGQLA